MIMFVSVLAFFVTMAVLFGLFGALLHAGSKLRDGGASQAVIAIIGALVAISAAVLPFFTMGWVERALR